jgi:RNA polymerase sigma-70 factor (ECF subfamily)
VINPQAVAIQHDVSGALDPPCDLALAAATAVPSAPPACRIRKEIRDNYEFLWRCLRRLGVTRASVEDAAQQVLIVFARRIQDVHPGAERAFLFATATRVVADLRKKQARSREVPDSEGLEGHPSLLPSAEQLIDESRARELLDLALAEMPLDLRCVFILFELEDLTMATIAQMLELPPGTVASRLRRARALFESTAARLQRRRRSP